MLYSVCPDAFFILRLNAERNQLGARQDDEVKEGKVILRAILSWVSVFYVIYMLELLTSEAN